MPVPRGSAASATTYTSALYSVWCLLERSWPIFTLPSASPYTTSNGWLGAHTRDVTGDEPANLLQMDFLPDQMSPVPSPEGEAAAHL